MQEILSKIKKNRVKIEFKENIKEWEDKKKFYSGIRVYMLGQRSRERRKTLMKILALCEI